jgi:arylsulfatase A-like enzyme
MAGVRPTIVLALLSVLVVALACRSAWAQPNIVHIIADDLGWVDLSGGSTNYGHGSNYYQTPNIDALAARGMSFSSAYVQQNCVPTRAALLTGQYAPRNGAHNVGSLNRAGNDTLLVAPEDGEYIRDSAITLAETLDAAGYTTAHFGKFHVAADRADISTQHGFAVNMEVGNNASGTAHMAVYSGGTWTFGQPEYDAYAQPYSQSYVDTYLAPYVNGNNPNLLVGTAKHLADGVTDAATVFLAAHAGRANPFYMNLAYSAVHAPITPRLDLAAKYNALPSTDPRHTDPAYAAFVETLDQAVARVVAAVDDPNGDGDTSDSIAANTLLLFSSDNGGHMGATDNSPLRERKGTLREGGVRVPLIAVMPGTIPAGAISDEAVHAVDFYPTYAEFAGAALPSPQDHVLDGESFAGILRGETSDLNRDAVFWHFPGYLDDRTVPTSLVTKDVGGKRYKLLYFYEDERYEFFNLSDDLSEMTDLLAGAISSADYAVARQMSFDLRAWLDDQGALYPTVRATGVAVPPPTPLPVSPPVEITFALGRDSATPDQAAYQLVQGGVTLGLAATGSGALLDWNSNGVGVNSTQDSGGDATQRRIDGSLTTPEAIEFVFDRDVAIQSIEVGAFETNGTESLKLSFVSGTNPFSGLAGYSGDYQVTANSLSFTTLSGAATPLVVPFGVPGQDELIVEGGTVLAITANPAVAGGVLFNQITIELLPIAGDYNNDGVVDAEDYNFWSASYGSSDAAADGNRDGVVDAADYVVWRNALTTAFAQNAIAVSPLQSAVPEPASGLLLILLGPAIVLICWRNRLPSGR